MDRDISIEERIKRAEEIAYKRKMQNIGVRVTSVKRQNEEKADFRLFKKITIQIICCLSIYCIFYFVKNSQFFLSEDILKKTNEVLSYDMNIEGIYNNILNFFKDLKIDDVKVENTIIQNGIGGAVSESSEAILGEKEISQMQTDAEEIKTKYQLIHPIQGTVTSRYGIRNPTTPTVPKNHTGIDIAASVGTKIKAALDGEVVLASEEGDYGKHLKIKKDDVEIIYAHCNDLYVKQGDYVVQGQEIAEVGATGNVTGPHLHFEIRKQDRLVNPDDILDF